MTKPCPCCTSERIRTFHEARDVPVNSVLSLDGRLEAQRFPRGDIRLGFCEGCGFIFNTTFEPERLEYSSRYDPSQAYSPTFNRWHRHLAEELISRHGLRGRSILEIGCGKGEFLSLLCELGDNRGVGFDPAFVPERHPGHGASRAEFVAELFSEQHASFVGDFVCCKMTLEHIQEAGRFVSMIRRAVGDRQDTTVYFQVPDARRILEECAFWDVYYEHCAYYTPGSLARLFRRCGFEVQRVERSFGGQYIALEARPGDGSPPTPASTEEPVEEIGRLVEGFTQAYHRQREAWLARIRRHAEAGQRLAVWGSGSKGVAFLTTLGLANEIQYVVDVNPHRQGKFMLGTGHPIVSPGDLRPSPPDVVIVMNPVYREEIAADLNGRGLAPEVWTT